MSTTAASLAPKERLEVLFGEIAELCGQRNAIDGRLVEIVAELERDDLCGMTGCRSIEALVAWKTGVAPRTAETMVAVAHRLDDFPVCADGLRDGRLSLDQVGVIAERAADGSDAHYAELAASATVEQLRTAITLAPKPDSAPKPEPKPEITKTSSPDNTYTTYRIRLPKLEAAKLDAGLQSHHDTLIAEHTADTDDTFPTRVDAFMSLVEAGWDSDVARRPHGQHTTVIVHVDVDKPAALHLGPLLSDDERRELLCDATCEVWFERDGQPIGAGRATRTVNRRLTAVRQILTSGRVAGLREHRGEVIGPAMWPAIITTAERDRILARMTARSVTKTRAPRTYLLSGMLRCGRCGNRLFSQARHSNPNSRVRRYVCLKGPDHGGCGRLTVVALPVEELLTDAVLTRLDSPQLAEALDGKASVDADVVALAAQLDADTTRLDELAGLYAEGAVSAREWIAARDPINERMAQARRDIAKATDTSAVVDLVGTGDVLRGQWNDLDIDRQQVVVRSVLDHAVIAPGTPGSRKLDINRVRPHWRV